MNSYGRRFAGRSGGILLRRQMASGRDALFRAPTLTKVTKDPALHRFFPCHYPHLERPPASR